MPASSIQTNLEDAAVVLLFTLTITSIICGILTLYIIRSMNTWNGYVLLVFALASSHLIYNVCYFLRFNDDICPYKAISSASGTAVCLWINTMSIIIFYTAMYQVSFRVKPYFWHLVGIITLCSVAVGLIEGIVCAIEPNYYRIYWTFFAVRLGSIIFNSLIYLIVTISLNLPYQSHIFGTLSDFAVRRKTNELILILVSRLRYYPIVQIITGATGLWWDLQFGFNPEPQDHYTLTQQACTYLYAVTFPFAGIGYFLIFLYVQPSAIKLLHSIVQRVCCCCCCGRQQIDHEGKDTNNISISYSTNPSQYDPKRVESQSKDSNQRSENSRDQNLSSSSTSNPQPFHINHMSHADVDEINSFDADDFQATGLSSSIVQPPRIDSNSMTSSCDRTASTANSSGWLRWNSRMSSSHFHQPRAFNFSRDVFHNEDNNHEVPIPAFILENDLNEDLIIEELQRRLNASHGATTNIQNPLRSNNS